MALAPGIPSFLVPWVFEAKEKCPDHQCPSLEPEDLNGVLHVAKGRKGEKGGEKERKGWPFGGYGAGVTQRRWTEVISEGSLGESGLSGSRGMKLGAGRSKARGHDLEK